MGHCIDQCLKQPAESRNIRFSRITINTGTKRKKKRAGSSSEVEEFSSVESLFHYLFRAFANDE